MKANVCNDCNKCAKSDRLDRIREYGVCTDE